MITKFKHILKFKQLPLFIAFASLLFPIVSVSAANNANDSVTSNFYQNNLIFYDPNECFEGTISSSSSGSYIGGNNIEEKIWTGLISMNYKPEIAAGIMGNMSSESGFNPARYESSHKKVWESGFDWETDTSEGYGVGLIQWSGERRVKFFQYMRKEANDLTDKYLKKPGTYGGLSGSNFLSKADSESDVNFLISVELQYLNQELKDNSSYSGIFSQTSVEDATQFFAENVEGCTKCKDENSSTMSNRKKEADRIFQAYNGKSFDEGETVATTSDYSNIRAAKNANESVSGVDSSSEWYAGWSDNDTAALKRVLEHYGDLAYQTGRALNVPWQAILVQMRYENPRAMCGSSSSPNNFWGMGCTGGSTAEAKSNLGEGFITYAKYVTNEYQKHAIGIEDPFEYLLELGPSWVQGCIRTDTSWDNGHGSAAGCVGYSEIESMKKSLEVLENYLQTSEGQAIVQSFGNYKVTSSSNDEECCNTNETLNMSSGDGVWNGAKYALNDTQLRKVSAMAAEEQHNPVGAAWEVSLMANKLEINNRNNAGNVDAFLNYISTSTWWAAKSRAKYASGDNFNETDIIEAVKDVLVNGNRTIPPQIDEHDWRDKQLKQGDINHIIGPDGQTYSGDSIYDDSLYVRGVTKIYNNMDSSYTFWGFPGGSSDNGDPFGYTADNLAASDLQPTKGSTTTSVAGSNVLWTDDGWISSGMDGFTKMEISSNGDPTMFGADYVTSSPNGKNPGPNKITLHAFEGHGGDEGLIKNTYSSGYPPHFTIDIKNRKVYQHMSIWKTSSSIHGTTYGDLSAGVQIEIMGYDNDRKNSDGSYAEIGYTPEWDLAKSESFSSDDWLYLAELLNAISVETGIPLTSSVDWSTRTPTRLSGEDFKSYEGILAHKHTPLPNDHSDLEDPVIWTYIETALSDFTGAQQQTVCPPAEADVAALQNLISEWTWRKTESQWDSKERKPAYADAISKRQKDGKYVGGFDGVDCGGFVTSLMQESGWDPDYNTNPSGNTSSQLAYLEKSTKWKDVTNEIHADSDAHPGDVLIITSGIVPGATGHTLVYAGDIPGYTFSHMASASLNDYAPKEDWASDIMQYKARGYRIYRNMEPPTASGGTLPAGGMTFEQAKKFADENYFDISVDAYKKLISDGIIHTSDSGYCHPADTWCKNKDALSNCTNFSQWFVNTQTDLHIPGGSNGEYWNFGFREGWYFVGDMARKFNLEIHSEPKVYSIFSTTSYNHTGVVVGIQGSTIITIEGCTSCGKKGQSPCDNGNERVCNNAHERDISYYNANGTQYIWLDGHMK